jgi:hypothetical protein
MIIEEITASYARKYGLPDYGNFEIFISMKAKVESTDNNTTKAQILIEACRAQVETQGEQRLKEYYEQKAAIKEKVKEIVNGSKSQEVQK